MDTEDAFIEPPNIYHVSDPTDIHFHPSKSLLTIGLYKGGCELYSYNSDSTDLLIAFPNFTSSMRLTRFSPSGNHIVAADNSTLAFFDVEKRESVIWRNDFFDSAPYECYFFNDNVLAYSQDNGSLNVIDVRSFESVYSVSINDYSETPTVSSVLTGFSPSPGQDLMMCSSDDGNMYTFDLKKSNQNSAKLFARTNTPGAELTSLLLIKSGANIVCSTTKRTMQIYKYDYFGAYIDVVNSGSPGVSCLAKVNEDLILAGCDDGAIKLFRFWPHEYCTLVQNANESFDSEGQSVERIAISWDQKVVASISQDRSVRFWDLQEHGDFSKVEDLPEGGSDADSDADSDDDGDDSDGDDEGKKKTKKVHRATGAKSQPNVKLQQKKEFFEDL